ncbi:porin [Alcanivorax sediminis]|uniref:Porin n=1 Tax=Alcanivorax sediminis TaxID=2663008 RepID=A0A6N7LSI6_9GAMM|nr:porin [Alcanivorax sediminis]MQX53388.1 porin [Alcanivorax sediminis]
MKKHLLALAVSAALPVSALAAPTFYGKINLSVDKTSDYPEGPLVFTEDDLSDAWFVSSNSSRLGVRGKEPLDFDNLSVIYQYEAGYDVDGDSSSTFSTRNSFLGLSTVAGKFFAGRFDSVVKDAEGWVDQFNETVADMDVVFLTQNRNSNTLNWESPELSGLVIRAQIAPGEGDEIGTAPDNELKDGLTDTWGVSVTLDNDALYAALAYESSYDEIAVVGTTFGGDRDALRGTFGVQATDSVQLGVIAEQVTFDPIGGDEADLMSYLVSGRVGLNDRLGVKAQAGLLDSSDLELDVQVVTLGMDYKLGDQTTAYGLLSASDTDFDPDGTANDFDESGNAFSVGMVHKF